MAQRKVDIVETRNGESGEFIMLQGVTLHGSAPVSGIFQVIDLDGCMSQDTAAGTRTVRVMCQFGSGPEVEDAWLDLVIPAGAPEPIGIHGEPPDVVVRRIALID
jgi:hypothetical protein